VVESKKIMFDILPKLALLSKEPEADFVDNNLPRLIVETFLNKSGDELSTMAL
jgi:hypothetical protein